jgi:putative hemolysin
LFSSRRAATIKAPARESWQFFRRPSLAAKPFAVGVVADLENRPRRQLEKRVRQGRRETSPAMRAGQHGCLRAFAGMTSVAIATATACVKFMQLNLWRAVSRYVLTLANDRFRIPAMSW